MEKEVYLQKLEERLSYYYDIEKNISYMKMSFDMYARFFEKNDRYIVSKKAVIYSSEINQHIFVKHLPTLEMEDLDQLGHIAKMAVMDYVKPKEDHMSSLISMVVLVDSMPSLEVQKKLKKYSYYKSFLFGFHGWVNIGFLLVDINSFDMIYNSKGREGKENFILT
ncbi:MAG: hypothetical protein Q3993_06630 [Filifactor alocis]|nr:hypothetical protein [Filifactor alocis]